MMIQTRGWNTPQSLSSPPSSTPKHRVGQPIQPIFLISLLITS